MQYVLNLFSPYKGLPREIYVLFIARIVNALGSFVMPLLTIILKDSIGMSPQEAGMYISISGIAFIPAALIGGKLADTIGRKVIIIVFETLAVALYILSGYTGPSMEMVYLLMLAGAFMATAGPAHDSLIADLTTPENRTAAYSLTYMGWNLGFAAGPLIGGILYEKHLAWVFYGDALTAFLAILLLLFFVKETIGRSREEIIDEKRALEKHEQGSIISVILRRPVLIAFALVIFGYNFAYSQWSFMLPMQILDYYSTEGSKYFGLIASFNGLVVILFTPLLTKLTKEVKEIRRAVYGGILYSIGFGMLGFVQVLPYFLLAAFIFTLGEIILAVSVIPFIANQTPASHRGRMNGLVPMILGAGYTLGPLGMGTALNYISIETGWIFLGVVLLVFSFLMFKLELRLEGKRIVLFQDNPEREKIKGIHPSGNFLIEKKLV